jgi:hypothetical protein
MIEAENARLKEQVQALTTENEALKRKIEQAPVAVAQPKEPFDIMKGAYYFAGDTSKPYCPRCYETQGKKHVTARVGMIALKCTVCGNVIHSRCGAART